MANPELDRRIYEEELCPWMPSKIIDCHVHVGLKEHMRPVGPDRKDLIWAIEVGIDQSWESMRKAFETLFPKHEVSVLAFGGVYQEVDVEANNRYVIDGISDPANHAKGLLVTRPEWDASVISDAMAQGLLGIKPYPDFAPQGMNDAGIFDFVPHSHLKVLNDMGGILMLHLPKKGRLGDPDNIRELLDISDKYPSIKMVVAHIGRSFCLPTAQKGLPYFKDRQNVYFDIAANLNADVFHYAIETVGPERILYGSDLPVTLMRGIREHVGEQYFNFTDGTYSWNVNRKSAEIEANYTYFLYEEIRALIDAVKRTGLGKEAIEKIMYSNNARLLNLKR